MMQNFGKVLQQGLVISSGKYPSTLLPAITLRGISLSHCRQVKEIKVVEKTNVIEVEGVTVESDRKRHLFFEDDTVKMKTAVSVSDDLSNSCVFCKLEKLGINVKHTDVLILHQFCNKRGRPLPRDVTNLCKRQHARLEYLVVMAEKAGLLPVYDKQGNRKELLGWEQNNKYYDESVIKELLTKQRSKA